LKYAICRNYNRSHQKPKENSAMLRPAAFLLLATLLLLPVVASAQTPTPEPTSAVSNHADDLRYRTIILQHATPLDVLKLMHWEKDMTVGMAPFKPVHIPPPLKDNQGEKQIEQPVYAKLPEGVVRIFALPSNNALLVEATPDGYEQVKEIVKTLDIAPRQVQLKTLFAAVPLSQNLQIDLTDPNQAVLKLHDANALFYQPPQVTADNNVRTTIFLEWRMLNEYQLRPLNIHTAGGSILVATPTLCITPVIQTDNSVILVWDFGEPKPTPNPAVPNSTIAISHNIPSDGMTAYDVTSPLAPSGYRMFLFVTPTVLSADTNNDMIVVGP
jgi:hypothetical protein